jgi:glyoxylase-like metal-dependent hydrolase (beta-lactamase superfamily II)
MPGHTPGSLVVLLDDGRAFVGDMMAGGYMGGAISPHRAGEHYFHADRARNLENIKVVLKRPIKMFHLGHGGPVTRESVETAFATGRN